METFYGKLHFDEESPIDKDLYFFERFDFETSLNSKAAKAVHGGLPLMDRFRPGRFPGRPSALFISFTHARDPASADGISANTIRLKFLPAF